MILEVIVFYISLLTYIEVLKQELFKYVDGTTGGPWNPMFHSLVIALLERKGNQLTAQHKMLPTEVIYIYIYVLSTLHK